MQSAHLLGLAQQQGFSLSALAMFCMVELAVSPKDLKAFSFE